MSPLPEQEVTKGLVGDLVKILLEELEIDCASFGSTTFKRQDRNVELSRMNRFTSPITHK
jgi:hypothetical protein